MITVSIVRHFGIVNRKKKYGSITLQNNTDQF